MTNTWATAGAHFIVTGCTMKREINRSPLLIEIMLACHCRPNPAEALGPTWETETAAEIRSWLIDNDLIDPGTFRSTEKGAAWVKFICETPLPTLKWEMGER
jgi:hypothetical protein